MDALVRQYGLPAIFGLITIKAAGIPMPPPADLIILLAGARAADGTFALWQVVAVLIAALTLGGAVEFWLARGPARGAIYRLGHHVGLTPVRLDAASAAIRRGGVPAVVAALLTPGVNATAVVACGLANMPVRTFLVGLVAGSAAEAAVHLSVGYAGGAIFGQVLRVVPLPWAVGVLVACLAAGLGAWMLIHGHRHPHLRLHERLTASLRAWHRTGTPVLFVWHGLWRLLPRGERRVVPVRNAAA
jgi:membrane protein DedA with SNARE-associated domain